MWQKQSTLLSRGISPLMAEEVCYRAGIDGGIPTDGLEDVEAVASGTLLFFAW